MIFCDHISSEFFDSRCLFPQFGKQSFLPGFQTKHDFIAEVEIVAAWLNNSGPLFNGVVMGFLYVFSFAKPVEDSFARRILARMCGYAVYVCHCHAFVFLS